MSENKSLLLLPTTMARAGWQLLDERDDVRGVAYEPGIATPQFHALLADAVGVALALTRFGEPEAAAAPRLRAVARIGVGYDTVDVAALTRRRIPLMVAGTANSPSVAEQALFFMLALAKRGAALDARVRAGHWRQGLTDFPVDLQGKSVLLIGFGRIGTRTAKLCRACGMKVVVFDPYVDVATVRAAECEPASTLDAALARADFVSLHCPKTDETRGLFDAARLARLKPGAYLINTARGGLVDELALHAALVSGKIAGAALDVLETEPPPSDHPLLGLPNVLVAPHMAGVTREAMDRMAVATVGNLLRALDGDPDPENVVNREVLPSR